MEHSENVIIKVYNSVNIQQLQNSISSLRVYLPFLHAVSGCDTTSALFNQGKRSVVRLAQNKQNVWNHMAVFMKPSSKEEVAEAGEKFLLALYKAESYESLNKYRGVAYRKNVAKVKLNSQFKLESLPPTSEAAKQHSFRVYFQVQAWLGNNTLSLFDWGWNLRHNVIVPHRTDKPLAHEKLLNLVSCNCKKGCKAACTCRKMGLSCSDLCGKCSEDGCSNTVSVEEGITNTYLNDITEINNNTPCYDDIEESISECVYESMLMIDF